MLDKPKQSVGWTKEKRSRIVGVFELLLNMDKKQNPNLYEKKE
jgi:hypothetical protein